jgi:hypothetical protein
MENKSLSCHGNKKGGRKGFSHSLMMILCCLLPILLIAALPAIGVKGSMLSFLAFLMCPLMHVGMMFMMRKSDDGNCCHENDVKKENSNISTLNESANLIE